MMFRHRIVETACLLLTVTWLLSGCTLFDPPETVEPPEGMVEHFSKADGRAGRLGTWWLEFGDDALDRLIREAIRDNFTIREAWARLEQARFTALKEGAAMLPELGFQSSVTSIRREASSSGNGSSEEWLLGFSASYELDLWGRVRSGEQSADLLARASEEDMKTAVISVTGQLAENWVRLVSLRRQQALYQDQARLQQTLLDLIRKRFELAKASSLELYQQKQAVDRLDSALVSLQSREQSVLRQIGSLAGRSTPVRLDSAGPEFPVVNPVAEIGLPTHLLANRPDIRAAVARLQASQWKVAESKADLLPSLRLTARHTHSSDQIDSLFDNWLQNLAAGLAGPLLDGGRRRAETARSEAVVDERLAAYGKVVFGAIKEVEDALADEERSDRLLLSLSHRLKLSERTQAEAMRRYLNGTGNFLNVLREEAGVLQLRQDLILEQENRLLARIRLYRSLGGSWIDEYVQ